MAVGAQRAGLSILHTELYREWSKQRKYPMSSSTLDENAWLTLEVRRKSPEFELIERHK